MDRNQSANLGATLRRKFLQQSMTAVAGTVMTPMIPATARAAGTELIKLALIG